jgi:CRISPR system Cascade subunit CasE
MFLSRVELSDRAHEKPAFWRDAAQPYGAHQALWRLLARGAGQKRDFLFRAEERGGRPSFLVLSPEKPADRGDGLWRIEAKTFAPALRAGQRLGFRLRASPVVRRGPEVANRTHRPAGRHDVVIDHRKRLEALGQLVPDTGRLAFDAGCGWLERQGKTGGFRLADAGVDRIGDDGFLEADQRPALTVDGYRQHRVVRRGEKPILYSTLEFEGVLEVTDPEALVAKVAAGFGPQKALGCGLMLLRRVG